jgi:hypothetical protein
MIKNSFLTSQLSFFNVVGRKKNRDKVKDALRTGVEAILTFKPKLFPQDSQHSVSSETSYQLSLDEDQQNANPHGSKKGNQKKFKFKKMFGMFSGKSSSNDEAKPAPQTRLDHPMSSKVASDLIDVPRKTPVGKDSLSESQDSQFKWGKEKTITRPTRSSSPIELFESHLAIDTDASKDDMSATVGLSAGCDLNNIFVGQSAFDGAQERLSNDELPLSESDTESEDEIEMLWGSQKKDAKDNEPEEPFQSLLQELNAQVLILIPREYLIRIPDL